MTETTDTPRYSTMDLEDAEAFYHDEITPQMRSEGLAPEHETPHLFVARIALSGVHQTSLAAIRPLTG